MQRREVKRQISRAIHNRRKPLFVVLCVSFALAFAVQAFGSFGKPRHFAVGAFPTSVVVADVNGDGRRDLVVANSSSNDVSVLLGNGAGSFGKARNFAAPSAPQSVAIGDLNGDGNLDLAVADTGSNSVSALLGNGAGGFGAATSYAVGRFPDSVAIGDLNRDGKPDLVVGNSGSSQKSVSVLLGNGDGSFGAATNLTLNSGPTSVAIGDLNGDGIPDLAASRRATVVSVLLGKGDSSFEAAKSLAVGPGPSSVAIGDLNGDGNLDLAVAINGSHLHRPGVVSVLLGDGGGNFAAAKRFGAGFHPSSVAIGDLNRDGKPDLTVSNATVGSGFGHISILIAEGGDNFAAPRHLRVGSGLAEPLSVAIGNLDAGSYPDLAVANPGSDDVSVLLNGGPSVRTLALSYRASSHRPTGRLRSWDPTCVRDQRVKVLRRRPGRDQTVGAATTSESGAYSIRRNAKRGSYYARVEAWSACRAENSKVLTLR
jgi:hypothetical protein